MADTPFPPQQQTPPGKQTEMNPEPQDVNPDYKGSGKLSGKVAIITGADSGIGRSVAILYAKESADIVVIYLSEDSDANITKEKVEAEGRKCLLIKGDVGDESFCKSAASQVKQEFDHIDILVNNAAEQHPQDSITDISEDQLTKTFRTNIFSMFFMTKAVLPELKEGSCIINTTSITAYRGSAKLLDYSSTKGAIVAFTRSLSQNLTEKKNPGQCRCPWSYLDATDSIYVPS